MNTHWNAKPVTEPSVVAPVGATVRRLFQLEMIERGYYVAQRGMINLSLPMQESDLAGFVAAVRDYLGRYGSLLPRT
jgi:glutamate-1-semialdehyde 2,1-aminomutase